MARRSKIQRETESRGETAAPVATPAAAPVAPRALKRHVLVIAALWALALVAYANSFRGGVVFDAVQVLGEDPRIQAVSAAHLHSIWAGDYWYGESTGLFRPLTTLSYLFNYSILGNGLHAAGYHWINFALHEINIALVYLLALAIFGELAPALALAALWAVHPVLTESVTNIVGRADLLSGFGVLAGLLCYIQSTRAAWPKRAWWLGGLALAGAIAIFSKESGIVLVAAVVLYDLAFSRGRSWSARLAGYAAAAVPVLTYLEMRSRALANLPAPIFGFADNPLEGADFLTGRVTAIKVIGKYLGLLVWPARLAADYGYRQIPLFGWKLNRWEDWQALLALVVCAAAAALALRCYRRAPAVFFFIGFFFATLAPMANLVILIGTIMAERFLYLPSLGLLGCVVWLAWRAHRRTTTRWPQTGLGAAAALVLICTALSARTFVRNCDWYDEVSLWTSGIQVSPGSYRAHINLASGLINLPKRPTPESIETQVDEALAILDPLPDDRNVPTAWAKAGLWYRIRGDLLAQSAENQPGYTAQGNPWYQKALQTFLRGERIDLKWRQMTVEESRAEGKSVAALGWPLLYLGLGRLYERLGEPRQAIDALRLGLSGKTQPEFYKEISASYHALGDEHQAAVALMEGVVIDPGQKQLAQQVVELYHLVAPLSCAVTGAGDALSLNLGCPLVRGHLCEASRNVADLYREEFHTAEAATVTRNAITSLGCRPEIFR